MHPSSENIPSATYLPSPSHLSLLPYGVNGHLIIILCHLIPSGAHHVDGGRHCPSDSESSSTARARAPPRYLLVPLQSKQLSSHIIEYPLCSHTNTRWPTPSLASSDSPSRSPVWQAEYVARQGMPDHIEFRVTGQYLQVTRLTSWPGNPNHFSYSRVCVVRGTQLNGIPRSLSPVTWFHESPAVARSSQHEPKCSHD